MDSKIAEIVARMKTRGNPSYITVQTSDFAEVMALVAEQQAKSAEKLERFTRWLVILTLALLIFTGFLCYDAYSLHHRPHPEEYSPTK